MNGLLDYLKQGQTALTNATGMDWNKIQADPGANAQALMGGTPMQYNQQPQSLISGGNNPAVNNPVNQPQGPNMPVENPTFTQQSPYTEAVVNAPQSPWGSAPQQGLIGGGSGVDFNQTAPTWGSGYDGTPTEGFKPIDTTLSQTTVLIQTHQYMIHQQMTLITLQQLMAIQSHQIYMVVY